MRTTKTGLIIPTVHLNGTSQDELVRQLRETCAAIRVAERSLAEATPHGRDYYVQDGPGEPERAILAARVAHMRRAEMLAEVREDLEFISMAVVDQRRNRHG